MKKACAILIPLMLFGGCNQSMDSQGSTTPAYERAEGEETQLGQLVTPVRIGESGANFAACNARGRTRDRAMGQFVPVRAAPFDQAEEMAQLAAGSSFFICSRSHDQRWFGIVYDNAGEASDRCGVSTPVPERRDYDGPCESGWVPSALVRLTSGIAQPAAAEAPASN